MDPIFYVVFTFDSIHCLYGDSGESEACDQTGKFSLHTVKLGSLLMN